MTLLVEGGKVFRDYIVDQLGIICPCSEISLTEGFPHRVVLGSTIDCCCGERIGCTLVQELVSPDPPCVAGFGQKRFTIKKGVQSSYDDDDRIVWVQVDERLRTECVLKPANDTYAIPAVTLAHELAHALLHCKTGSLPTEAQVGCVENQIRKENDDKRRCRHGMELIPQSCVGLSNSWYPDEDCSPVLLCMLKGKFKAVLLLIAKWLPWPRPREAGPMNIPSRPTLPDRAAEARQSRGTSEAAERVDRLLEQVDVDPGGPPEVWRLEQVVVGQRYAVTVILVHGPPSRAVEVVTNWSGGPPWPVVEGELYRFRIEADPSADEEPWNALRRAVATAERSGAGGVLGKPSVWDGALEVLTPPGSAGVATADHPWDDPGSMMLYGISGGEPTDADQVPYWDAIQAFLQLRKTLLARGDATLVEIEV